MNMASVTYNEKSGKFRLIYLDAVKATKGDKYPYTRKQESWTGKKKPTKREIEVTKARLLNEGILLEEAAQREADKIRSDYSIKNDKGEIITTDETEQKNAVLYFLNLKPTDLSKAESKKSIQRVQRIINTFTDFLKKNYPLIPLDGIKKEHISEFFETLHHLASEHQRQFYTYLTKIWKKIISDFEESSVKYINPFDKLEKDDLMKENFIQEKMAFTTDQMKQILLDLVNDEKNKNIHGEQKFSIFYFLIVTGWRVTDILSLQWSQVNLQNRTISLIHSKTKMKSGHETIIFITPLMKRILERQKENSKQHPHNTNLVFNIRPTFEKIERPASYIYAINRILFPSLEKQGLLKTTPNKTGMKMKNYTVHCFRKSTITELSLSERFASDHITYLVGHANNTVEKKHYLKLKMYPERSTRKMLEHLEEITNLEYFYNLLISGRKETMKKEFNANTPFSETEIYELKMNFWTDEAIEKLNELYKGGIKKLILETLVYVCNKNRLEQGKERIEKSMVDDVMQMLNWVNADKKLQKSLS